MKPGNWIVRTVMWVMMLTIAAYFGVYVLRFVFSGYETAVLYTYSAEEIVETKGYVVREEQVVEGGSELSAVVVGEGEKVAVGDTLAIVYDNEAALFRHQDIMDMEERLQSLYYIFSHSVDGADSAALNGSIVNSIVNMRKAVSDGDMTEASNQISQLKMMLFRRDYTYNGSNALNEEIMELTEETKKLAEENRSYTSTITPDRSGTFSGMVDGYENVLTPETIRMLTPQGLDALLTQREDVQERLENNTLLGKLVTGNQWYYVATLHEKEAERLKMGKKISVRLSSMERPVTMQVEALSVPDENRKVCAVLSTDQFMGEATLLRDQAAELVLNTVTGFRVPKSAIHVENISGEVGVYRIFGVKAKWVPVEILWEDEDYYLIGQPVQKDEEGHPLPQTALEQAEGLRDGVQVVVKGRDLYDGKVMER